MSYKNYSDYIQINLPWLSTIPKSWEILRCKNLFNAIDIRSKNGDEQLLSVSEKHGVIQRKNLQVSMFQAMSYIGHKLAWPNDLVINSLWAWMGGLGFSKYHGIVSTAYGVYRLKNQHQYLANYLNYLVRSNPFNWELRVKSKGIWRSRYQLTDDSFFTIPILVPPIEHVSKIVSFLDYKCAQINKYIQKKKRLIELLKEQKQAIINQAVTKGLDPNVRLKSSGVEWLGDIPEHWEIRRLRFLGSKFGSGITPKGGAAVYSKSGIPFLRSQNIHFDQLKLEDVVFIDEATHHLMVNTHIKPHDVLLNITGASIGRVCHVPKDFGEGNVNQHVCIVRPNLDLINPEYLAKYLSSSFIQNEIILSQNGASREGLTLKLIKSIPVILPTLSEQIKIVQYFEIELKTIDKLIGQFSSQINLIQEYRTRLISDVVTGKIDVRNIKVDDVVSDGFLQEEEVSEEAEEESLDFVGANNDD